MLPSPNAGLQRVKLVKNPNYVRDGARAYAHLLRKYEFTPTIEGPFLLAEQIVLEGKRGPLSRLLHKPHHFTKRSLVKKRTASGRTGDVDAQDIQNDSEYLAQVGIGTHPTQYFNLDFDTGSSDLWVWSTALPHQLQDRRRHNIYDPRHSDSFKPARGQTWNIAYGDGSTASGIVRTDTLNVGGLIVKNQAIEMASKLSDSFVSSAGDGLLGLAWPVLNTVQPNQVNTPVQNMILQGDVAKGCELFTAYLTNSKDGIEPCYTFGYIDERLLGSGTIYYTPVDNTQGFWQIASTSVSINGRRVSVAGGTAVMDTGTTLALIDDQTCSAIYSAIPGARQDNQVGGWVFPTAIPLSALPLITLDIGGTPCALHREDLAYADAGAGFTYGGIQSRGTLPFNLYGDTVLKSMYAIFDQGEKRFGFVQRPDPSERRVVAVSPRQAAVAPVSAAYTPPPPPPPPSPLPVVNVVQPEPQIVPSPVVNVVQPEPQIVPPPEQLKAMDPMPVPEAPIAPIATGVDHAAEETLVEVPQDTAAPVVVASDQVAPAAEVVDETAPVAVVSDEAALTTLDWDESKNATNIAIPPIG